MKTIGIVAIACADLHLSHRPPIARSLEPDWYATMGNYLDQFSQLSQEQDLPVICAGDVFDDGWRSNRCPPELLNFAISKLPVMYAVPGQHDLKYHRYEDKEKTAYWTLKEAGKIIDLIPDTPVEIPVRKGHVLRLHGFPWGVPIRPLKDPHDMMIEVAVVHDYVWTKETGYPGAPKEKRLANRRGQFKGYDITICGDNHLPFSMKSDSCTVFNCGSFLRRKIDEISHKPSVGIVYSDNTVKRHYLDCSHDKFLTTETMSGVITGIGFESIIEALSELGNAATDFHEAVKRTLEREKVPSDVKQLIIQLLEGVKDGKS